MTKMVEICTPCNDTLTRRMAVTPVVKQDHVGGARIVRTLGHVETRIPRKTPEEVVDDLKVMAIQLGATAVIGLQFFKDGWVSPLLSANYRPQRASGTAVLAETKET